MDNQTLSIYLHIPFCKVMCSYCSFNTYTGMENIIPPFVDALSKEIRYVGQGNQMPVGSIFFGGGSPSMISLAQYDSLFAALRKSFTVVPDAEITIESNPNDLSRNYLAGLRSVGINRLSIGMQSSNPQELKLFNRQHDTQTVIDAVAAAQSVGFDNISLDLIFGIPNQGLDSWRETLHQAIALNIQNISAYNLILEGNTPLKAAVDAGEVPSPDDDLDADMYDLLTEMMAEADFEQYEISNWAKAGYESRHNIQYWRNWPYLGLGAGAHGFANGIRYIVTRYPQRYIDTMKENSEGLEFPCTPAVTKATVVDRENDMAETILMGLRMTKEGIPRERFKARFGVDIVELHREAIEKHVGYGLLYVDDEHIRITQAGRLLSNAVIRDLI
jgi:oxygen-independent coproporphyrinogen III oxidase